MSKNGPDHPVLLISFYVTLTLTAATMAQIPTIGQQKSVLKMAGMSQSFPLGGTAMIIGPGALFVT